MLSKAAAKNEIPGKYTYRYSPEDDASEDDSSTDSQEETEVPLARERVGDLLSRYRNEQTVHRERYSCCRLQTELLY